jgi:hypothetical protein
LVKEIFPAYQEEFLHLFCAWHRGPAAPDAVSAPPKVVGTSGARANQVSWQVSYDFLGRMVKAYFLS